MEDLVIEVPEARTPWQDLDRRYREGALLLAAIKSERARLAGPLVPAPRQPLPTEG